MRITLYQLEVRGACIPQAKKFKELFGESVEVTLDLCLKHAQDFDWNWGAHQFLSPDALKFYQEHESFAHRTFLDAMRPFQGTATTDKEYAKVRVPAWEAYNDVRAAAFFHAFEKDHES